MPEERPAITVLCEVKRGKYGPQIAMMTQRANGESERIRTKGTSHRIFPSGRRSLVEGCQRCLDIRPTMELAWLPSYAGRFLAAHKNTQRCRLLRASEYRLGRSATKWAGSGPARHSLRIRRLGVRVLPSDLRTSHRNPRSAPSHALSRSVILFIWPDLADQPVQRRRQADGVAVHIAGTPEVHVARLGRARGIRCIPQFILADSAATSESDGSRQLTADWRGWTRADL